VRNFDFSFPRPVLEGGQLAGERDGGWDNVEDIRGCLACMIMI